MKKILLTMFLILCNVLAVSAQNGGAIKGDAYFNQRVVGLKKAGTLEQEVTSRFSDVYVQGIKVIGPMNEKDLRYLAKLAKGGTLNDLHSANLTDAVVENIPEGCFKDLTYFMYIYFPSSLKSISDNAFKNCNLLAVVLNDGLETIGNSAFYGVHSKSLTIPASVKHIGDAAFAGNKDYKTVTVDGANTNFKMVQNMLCDVKEQKVLQCFDMAEGVIDIPQGMKSIGDEAFSPLHNVTTVRLPSSVTRVGNEAFSAAYGLKNIEVAAENPSFTTVDGVLFNKDQTDLITYPASKDGQSYTVPTTVKHILDGAFAQAGGQNAHKGMKGAEKRKNDLVKVTVPEGVESIGKDAFLFSGLSEISLPKTLKSIGSNCFYYTDLTQIVIPEGVTRLEDATFGACAGLEKVTLPSTLNYIGRDIFAVYNPALTDILLYAEVPPVCDDEAFHTFDNSVTLHVVGSAVKKYKQNSAWGNGPFDSIVGDLTPTGVAHVGQSADNVTVVGIYDIHGMKLQHKVKGLNILKMSDGSVRKVMINTLN